MTSCDDISPGYIIPLLQGAIVQSLSRSSLAMGAPSVCFLLLLLLLINGVVGQRRGESRSLLDVQCAATTSSFESFLFVDLKLNSDLDGPQLIELEFAVKDTYNAYTKNNYCDLKFREIFEVEATFWEQVDQQGTMRFLLRIDGRCKGCTATDDIFSLNTRRDLAPLDRTWKGKGMKMAASGIKTCTCRNGVGFGTPSNREYEPLLQKRISSKKKQGVFPSIDNFLSIIEVDPVPCGEETFFDSAVLMSFGSSKTAADINPNDVSSLPGGFKDVYNELQQGRCDSQFRTIDSGDAFLLNARRLDEYAPELARGLASTTLAKYIVKVNMSLRGRCRSCPNNSVLVNDAVKRRELQENQQTGLCFCAADAKGAGRSGPPSSGEFTKAFTSWIEVERNAGRLTDLVSAKTTTQIDPLDQSANPSYGPTAESFNPSTSPSITTPSRGPLVIPSTAPATTPPSRRPFTLDPSASPSFPTSDKSFDPSMAPSSTSLASMAPSRNNLPSAMPSFSTLCSGVGVDSQLLFQQYENGDTTGWTNVTIDQSGSDFSKFLGRFKSGDAFPQFVYKGFNATDVAMLYFGLTFYEIDNWNNNGPGELDTLSMKETWLIPLSLGRSVAIPQILRGLEIPLKGPLPGRSSRSQSSLHHRAFSRSPTSVTESQWECRLLFSKLMLISRSRWPGAW